MKNFLAGISSLAILASFAALACGTGLAQSPLNWGTAQHLDTGVKPSVAVIPSGLVVEFHRSEHNNSKVWYHIGRARQTWDGREYISWGPSRPTDYVGDMPFVAVTREGYVLMVYTRYTYTGYKGTTMRYFAGKVNPNGDTSQAISWQVKDAFFDTGQFARLSFNSNDVLIEAHESSNNSSLFYRVGHFRNPIDDDFALIWDSVNGSGGVKYDEGVSPAISINDKNQVIECHRDASYRHRVHYHRGTLNSNRITFAGDRPVLYDTDASQPSVALTNNGTAMEADIKNDYTFARVGVLNENDSARVDWSTAVSIGWDGWKSVDPTIATNGTVAIATWASNDNLFYSIAPVK